MRLALYIFATFALMAIVAAFTYTVNPDHYTIELMGINFNFPIAVWIVLPMLLLIIFTLVHMLFYGLKNYFALKKWQKENKTIIIIAQNKGRAVRSPIAPNALIAYCFT